MTQDIGTSICEKLDITNDQLNSMYATGPVNGFVGTDVAAEIVQRFSLSGDEPMGAQLAERGILTDDEAEYLDDAD